jgi:hypothetical protein
MGTNYYRIPTEGEMEKRKKRLQTRIDSMDMSPNSIERGIPLTEDYPDSWDVHTPWTEFLDDVSIHLGKRSSGWKFCWNFHKDKYYTNKEELLSFIRSGRVVDEYGAEWNVEDFITMALEWGQPNGLVVNEIYRLKERAKGHGSYWTDNEKYDDLIIDGLRVSTSTEFS